MISVRDSGGGIPPETVEQVFEVFERLHSRIEHDETGIGLAICQRVIEYHDGAVRADSEPGGGATFSATLPMASDRRD